MSEREWRETLSLYDVVLTTDRATLERKLPAFEAAVLRTRPDLLTDPLRERLSILERFVAEGAPGASLPTPSDELRAGFHAGDSEAPADTAFYGTLEDVWFTPWGQNVEDPADTFPPEHPLVVARGPYVALARDIFGNPFRPVAFSPDWRTETVRALARQIWDSQDFSVMPVLADALQDAGCNEGEVLNHCRGPGPHARGCWVLDLVFERQPARMGS